MAGMYLLPVAKANAPLLQEIHTLFYSSINKREVTPRPWYSFLRGEITELIRYLE
jgi:hypothetical protein